MRKIETLTSLLVSLSIITSSIFAASMSFFTAKDAFLSGVKTEVMDTSRFLANMQGGMVSSGLMASQQHQGPGFAFKGALTQTLQLQQVIEQNGESFDAERLARLVKLKQLDNPTQTVVTVDGYLARLEPVIDDSAGYVLTAMSLQRAEQFFISSYTQQTLPLLVTGIALVIILTMLLIKRLVGRFSQLSQFVNQVAENRDFSQRYKNHSSDDEVGRMAKTINYLLFTIEEQITKHHTSTKRLIDQQRQMIKLANYDPLTSLPNRQYVMDTLRLELSRAKKNNRNLSLIYFDLDGFKDINDSLGHDMGDKVLVCVAQRVKRLVRNGDIVARIGGDEFLIVRDKVAEVYELDEFANRLLDAFAEELDIEGTNLKIGLSIGIATAIQSDYNMTELVGNADIAMYRAKSRGKSTYVLFSDELYHNTKRRIQIANSMSDSLKNNDFEVNYQVKVGRDGQVAGYEALARWHHPELGNVSPIEFIEIAEYTGRIQDVTRWVLRQVVRDIPKLIAHTHKDITVAVNFSAHDVTNPELYNYIADLLFIHNVPPKNLEIEVTESTYLTNFAVSNQFFQRISQLGCSVALDDFGTGYSSLGYLTQIDIDKLKIDRQFVRGMNTSKRQRLVTEAIIDLATRLELLICAEGIEDYDQQKRLISRGCHEFQGFLYSKPAPLQRILERDEAYRHHFGPSGLMGTTIFR